MTQHRSDVELLELLGQCGEGQGRWICRRSTTGRGLRLHQTSCVETHLLSGEPTHDTPREALEAFLDKVKERASEGKGW